MTNQPVQRPHQLGARQRPLAAALVPLVCFCAMLAGCGVDRLEYTEFKRIDEKITESELQHFLRVIDGLPDKKLPEFDSVFAPLPNWNPTRTLPVKELAHEEQKGLDRRWSVEEIARKLDQDRKLKRVLRREKMTVEQFVGISLTIGAALSKSTLRDQQKLDDVIAESKTYVVALNQDDRPFSKLKRELQHSIVSRAGYLTRNDRAKRLNEVPPENVALVRKHFEELKTIFPTDYTSNPFDAIADLLKERGMPFEELKVSGFDAEISWDPENATIGTDTPDRALSAGSPNGAARRRTRPATPARKIKSE